MKEIDTWLMGPSSSGEEIGQALSDKTYIGIDFGTSTSVVSVMVPDSEGRPIPQTLEIDQPEELGGTIRHHLVNSVLAFRNNRLLFGNDAYQLRQKLFEGKNVFSSFKMRLGIDIGPTYPETELSKKDGSLVIETAADATREFFKLFGEGIMASIEKRGLPDAYHLAVSVPASFEVNQRQDLLTCLKDSGLVVSENCLIDEPNAAFLNYLYENAVDKNEDSLVGRLREGAINVLVYDFGAGTCDVSILEIGIKDEQLKSRNRAISKFTALGGDDFDMAIARDVLLGQLLGSAPTFDPTLHEINERLVPLLQPVAESLKIAAVKWLEHRGITTLEEVRKHGEQEFTEKTIPPCKIRKNKLKLSEPTLTLAEFADAMEPLIKENRTVSNKHVFAPVEDAIEKSGLENEDELHSVLFIGGSSTNPVVRTSVMNLLPESVKAIVPRDLRSHVSLGAAMHSFAYHAFGMDLVQPITPENIYIITRDKNKELVLPASSEVPTKDKFRSSLTVETEGQNMVELPICARTTYKLLGILKINAPNNVGFSKGDKVSVAVSITHDKMLKVEAEIAGTKARVSLFNPLSNRELSEKEKRMLKAKQKFNISLLENQGRPPKEVILEYADSAYRAEEYETAAEMYIAVERMNPYPSENHATAIVCSYSRTRQRDKAHKWAIIAHSRDKDHITAFNLSLFETGKDEEILLRKAHEICPHDQKYMLCLGQILFQKQDAGNKAEGKSLLEECVRTLKPKLEGKSIKEPDCVTLYEAANLLDQDNIAQLANERLIELQANKKADFEPYSEANLAASIEKLPPPMIQPKEGN